MKSDNKEKGAHVGYIHRDFTTRHERRSAKSTSCGRDRPQDPTFRGRTPTYQHTTYSNPRQSIQQCSDAQTCSAAADSHHNSGHDRPSHHAQTSNISTRHDCNAASIHPTSDPNMRQWGPTAPASTQREGVDIRSISARTHGQRLQPRLTPTKEAPRRGRGPQSTRSPKSFSGCRALRALTCAANMGDW